MGVEVIDLAVDLLQAIKFKGLAHNKDYRGGR